MSHAGGSGHLHRRNRIRRDAIVQRGSAESIHAEGICLALKEDLDVTGMVKLGCPMQRREALVVKSIDQCPNRESETHL